ncbi:transporter substrate-binding domain-containing protein [Dongia rigui]|uniref:Transporter substrate-binding domain-containing protein n=1 Tax=Dongia rigui TaxID=940149 RepID=A0ABU5DZJ0_9PROT|nr:transporter substrate-binding domain-containing protein [Dongia rigui]MDY0872742.1 transporter substrate-binding domain-containing protein [Dongia rigui]
MRAWQAALSVFMVGSLCLASPAAQVLAADAGRDFGCTRPVRVGLVEFGPMYHQGKGVDIDLLDELARRTGCQFDIRITVRAKLWPAIEAGDIDIATNSISTPDRARLARFVTFFGFKNMMVMPSAEVGTTFSMPALVAKAGWRLGLVQGFRYGNYYDYHLKMLLGDDRVIFYETQEALFNGLRHGEVEAILAPSIHYFFYLTAAEREHFTLVNASPAPPTPSGLALSRARFSAAQTDNWLRVVEGMRLDRTLHRIAARRVSAAAANTMIEY